MSASGDSCVTFRRGREDDVERILDLLTHYDQQREYFEPWYLSDPTYRPEQSWVADIDGRLVAHLRIYDRWIRVAGIPMRIAGLGNVITAQEERGHGYIGSLLRAMLDEVSREPYAYSLLWTHLPDLYRRYGWAPIRQEVVRGTLSPPHNVSLSVALYDDDDLDEVMDLYEETNAPRTGPAVRSAAEWQGQRAWLGEDPYGFLTARAPEGTLVGYVRSRNGAEILDLGLRQDDVGVGRALLAALAQRGHAAVYGALPPSLWPVLPPDQHTVEDAPGLMGRIMNPDSLVRTLEPLWRARLHDAGQRGTLVVETPAGTLDVLMGGEAVGLGRGEGSAPTFSCDEETFGALLFRGFEAAASESIHDATHASLIRTLFPPQDFVIWGADRF